LRPGFLTVAEAWSKFTELPVGFRTETFLQEKFPAATGEVVREVDAAMLPLPELVSAVLDLEPGQVLVKGGRALAFCEGSSGKANDRDWNDPPAYLGRMEFAGEVIRIERPWHLFQHCSRAILNDFVALTDGRRSESVSAFNTVIGDPDLLFVEPGAVLEASIINTKNGPVFIGRDAEVMEGCLIRGPFALGERAQLKMGAKIYGATAIGPHCRVGGEVNNSVIMGYSNKAHDGFLGNSVLGEWCNLGADTNNGNLKNTYGEVNMWSYAEQASVPTGLQFCGLIMGDHSKSGINTMFNTGTVVGVCANVFGGGFPPRHIPSFAWGGADGLVQHVFGKATATMQRVMERRRVPFTALDERILRHVYDHPTGLAD
jgi:UDP-N-acetylglucosamine diphosphorylase/glucosamine-1-phosphate N-acetyltransferase